MIIGIDPGASGGIALIDTLGVAGCTKMPDTLADIWEWFSGRLGANDRAYIENVSAMPRTKVDPKTKKKSTVSMGAKSAFVFGGNFYALQMALTAAEIPYELVTPRTWQKALGLQKHKGETKTQHKNRMKARAQQLYPSIKVTLATADALLIATYGQRLNR